MQAVAVARSLLLIALAVFLAGDLVSLVNRIAATQEQQSGTDVGHHTNALPQKERLARLTRVVKNSCLPKLICELNAAPEKERLNQKAKTLLQLIRHPHKEVELILHQKSSSLTFKETTSMDVTFLNFEHFLCLHSYTKYMRDTSISMTAEVSSRYHFAAHMGQLISGIDGTGCHNFYPGCPLPSVKVLSLLNKPSLF